MMSTVSSTYSQLEHGAEALSWRLGKSAVEKIVPELSYDRRKGQAGRVAVLGGSIEYTGAPYYAAASTLQVGADLAFIFTAEEAAIPIKCYSPELIVLPCYNSEQDDAALRDSMAMTVEPWLDRLHALVIGPGLGRREGVLSGAARILQIAARDKGMPVIIDADGLYLVARNPQLVANCPNVILTPNAAEYDRLLRRVLPTDSGQKKQNDSNATTTAQPEAVAEAKQLLQLAQALGGVTIIKKGPTDLISDGESVLAVHDSGSPRRCGGIGDLLSGSAAVFAAWTSFLPTDDPISALDPESNTVLATARPYIWASYAACILARRSAASAFALKRRSMTAPDILARLGETFEDMCPTFIPSSANDDSL